MRGGNDTVDAKLFAELQALFRQYVFSAGTNAHIRIAAAPLGSKIDIFSMPRVCAARNNPRSSDSNSISLLIIM